MISSSTIKARILIVDDDEDILMLMKNKLSAEGYITFLSPNGANVMDIITQNQPDLVLLDIHMNGVDGGSICNEIKSNPELHLRLLSFFQQTKILKVLPSVAVQMVFCINHLMLLNLKTHSGRC